MAAKKPAKKKVAKIPFLAEHIPVPSEELKEVPPELPPEPPQFKAECKVSSLGMRYWSGMVFVALEAVDGQNLLDLLRKGQKVTIHYKREPAAAK